ncbi:MAG: Uma2 family endonuclease [Leptolyngbya sp. SIO3F4]|nr:Uma2 family endonuclease [Leptolyngbya sp. SIO3F4]
MSQALSAPYFTLEQYLAYTAGTDTRYELVDGALVEMPPESDENLSIARTLLLELIKHFPPELVTWGTEIEVSGRRVSCRIPDLLVHSEESKAALVGSKRATITHDMPPPALVIEVVSTGQTNRDRDYRYKHTEYAARAIEDYWIVDPELQQITVCHWENGMYEDTIYKGDENVKSTLVPDFDLTPNNIFGA